MKTIIKNRLFAKTTFLSSLLVLSTLFFAPIAFGYQIETIDTSHVANKDFVVGPGKVEIELKPGEQKTVNLKVSNRMGDTRLFKVDIEDFTGSKDPEQTVVLLGAERGPYSLRDYLQVPEMNFELKDGERATVPVTISVPTDAEPGGLYGTVLITTTSKNGGKASGGSAIISRIGTLFFVNVPGTVRHDGNLKEFQTASGGMFFSKGPIDFRLLYENNGSTHVNPYGEVKIQNIFGEEVGNVVVDPWFAMPTSLRLREVSWNRPFLFGMYKATANVNRGYDDIIDSKSITFWVIPWKIVVLALLGLIVFVFIIRFIFTRFEIKKK